ncbi:GIY-YIG nuclease family protein [Pelobium manganitolerans]|uniref:GIY-YIG nuclease family protein n=1 Tax=Pelobium manganitolerans TaxID=1842495 RepID=UPI003FA3BBB8
MFKVYILYSQTLGKYYIGSTCDIVQRLKKHNNKHLGFTGGANDWVVKYTESYEIKADALKREKEIKGWKSKMRIAKLIAGSEHPV